MLEKNLHKKVVQFCKESGILAVKVDSSSSRGWPDLTLLLPGGTVLFVELKTQTGKLSVLQEVMHDRIKENKGNVYTIRSLEEIQALIKRATV